MLRLIPYIIFFMLPALLTGYLILIVFPHIPKYVLVVLNMTIIIGAFVKYKQNQTKKLTAQNRLSELPDWLKSKTSMVILVVLALMASLVIYQANKTILYIDNASEKEIAIKISHEGTRMIKPGAFEKVEVVKGEIEFEYNNKKKQFNIPNEGKWVFNIDTLNTYIKTLVTYTNHRDLYRNGKNIPPDKENDMEIIKKEFFESNCDYVFDVPEKISVKRKSFGSGDVNKTVLYRINSSDFLEKSGIGADDREELNNDTPDGIKPEEPVIIRSKKNKNN